MSKGQLAPTLRQGQLIKSSVMNMIGMAIPLVVAVIAIPTIINSAGYERFGILTLTWAIIGYAGIFDLGLGRTLTLLISQKLGSEEENQIPDLFWTTLVTMLILSLVIAAAIMIFSSWFLSNVLNIPSELLKEAMRTFLVVACCIPIIMLSTGLRGVFEAYQRFDLVNVIRLPVGVLIFIIPAVVLPFRNSITLVIALLLLTRFLSLLVQFLLAYLHIPQLFNRIRWNRSLYTVLLRTGGWMTISNIISPIMLYIDRFFLGAVVSVTAVAYYATSFEVATKLLIISGAISSVLFPIFSNISRNRKENAIHIYWRGVILTAIGIIPVTMILGIYAQEILSIWIDKEFALHSYRIFQILLIGTIMNALASIPYSLIQGFGRPDVTALFHIIEVIIYIPLLWFLLLNYGTIGAAFAWTLRVILDAVLLHSIAFKLLRQSTIS